MARWGIDYDAGRHLLSVAPRLGGAGREGVGPFRAGRTVMVLSIRERPGTISLRISVTFGPAIRVAARLGDALDTAIAEVDGVTLGRAQVGFEARGEHEVIWRR